MTTEEIQDHIDTAIRKHFENPHSESGEIMTSAGGDGRFVGKVIATRYADLRGGKDLFLAIGQSEERVQIIKLGKSECLTPGPHDLDLLLLKELGIE